MFNLMRMDFRRALKSKSVYVILLILAACMLISVITMKAVTSPDMAKSMSNAGVTFSVSNVTEKDLEEFMQMSDLQAFYSTAFRGGFFGVMLYIIAVLMICTDFRSGFAKNIFALNSKRYGYAVSKWLMLQVLSLVSIVLCWILFRVSCTIFSLNYLHGSLSDFLKMAGYIWIVQGAFNAQAIALSLWTRSEGMGIAGGIIMPGGLVVMLLETFLGLFHISIIDYTLYGCMDSLSFPISLTGTGRALATALLWTVIWMAAAVAAVQKKDV